MGVMLALAAVGGLVLLALSTREDEQEQSGEGGVGDGAGNGNANLALPSGAEPLLPAVAQYLATATDPLQIESFAATLAPNFPTTAEMLRQRAAQIRAAAASAAAAIPQAPAYGMPPIPFPTIPQIPIPPIPQIPIPTMPPNIAPPAPAPVSPPSPFPIPIPPIASAIPGVPPAIDPAILARIQDILGGGGGGATPSAPSATPQTPTLDPATWGLQIPSPGPAPAPGQPPSPLRPGDVPAVPTFDEPEARRLASRVGTNLRSRGRRYDHALMRQFQRAAGINADGLYGGSTRGALIYFGVRNPPAAYVRSTSRGRETVAYQPPSPAAAA